MTLDRQKIISELGSVLNQIQNANCGCMGQLFGSSQQGSYPCRSMPMGMGGGGGAGGDPSATAGGGMGQFGMGQSGMAMGQSGMGMGQSGMGMGQSGMGMGQSGMGMRQPCMGRCDPAKLYANTYGYLSQNLMKPVMNEVYNDLKSITPANSIGNNPLAAHMGLSPGSGNPTIGGQMDGGGMMMSESQSMMGGGQPMMGGGQLMTGGSQPMTGGGQSMMGGGSQMMGGGQQIGGGQPMMGSSQPMMGNNNMGMRKDMTGIGGMGEQIMRMMTSGGGGNKPKNVSMQGQANQFTDQVTSDVPYSAHDQMGMSYTGQNPRGPASPGQAGYPGMAGQGFADEGQLMGNSMAGQPMSGDMTGQPMSGNISGQPMGGSMAGHANMTQRQIGGGMNMTPQITNSMMPVAGQNMASSRSYGHTAGVKRFSDMFPGVSDKDLGFDPMAIALQMNPANQKRTAMSSVMSAVMQPQSGRTNAVNPQPSQQLPPDIYQGQEQQVYTASEVPTMNQQPFHPGEKGHQDPNTQYQEGTDPNGEPMETEDKQPQPPQPPQPSQPPQPLQPPQPPQPLPQQQQVIRDPIFPAERQIPRSLPSTHKYATYYNTLGQPYHVLPQNLYKAPQGNNMPQSLSWPEPDPLKYAVKQTMSKTSLTGNLPLGNNPSRSQLRHYYRQIKGNQGIKATPMLAPTQLSSSEGELNSVIPIQDIPIEKVGGDSIANNPGTEKGMGNQNAQIRTVRHEDIKKNEKVVPIDQNVRNNGLQDRRAGRYLSNAWTFSKPVA